MQIQNGTEYDNNYARAAAYFLGTCARPPAAGPRLAAYSLITGIYRIVFDDAQALGFKPVPDVHFAPWEPQKGREKDIKSIRGAIDQVESLISELYTLARTAEPTDSTAALLPAGMRPGRSLAKALAACGIVTDKAGDRIRLTALEGCFEGLLELAAISCANTIPITDGPKANKPHLYFSRCVFDPVESWTAMAFDRLLDANGRLLRLCSELEARGYTRVDCFDGKKISLDYVKQHGRKPEPLKLAWGERTHSGISLTYEELRLAPCFLWIRMPMFRTVLENASKLPLHVAQFVADHTKNCDGCRYCVQTDRTHTRPLASMKLDGKDKCPLYPGFTMNWRTLPEGLDQSILELIDALNELPELA